jgi:hypothetical protein
VVRRMRRRDDGGGDMITLKVVGTHGGGDDDDDDDDDDTARTDLCEKGGRLDDLEECLGVRGATRQRQTVLLTPELAQRVEAQVRLGAPIIKIIILIRIKSV